MGSPRQRSTGVWIRTSTTSHGRGSDAAGERLWTRTCRWTGDRRGLEPGGPRGGPRPPGAGAARPARRRGWDHRRRHRARCGLTGLGGRADRGPRPGRRDVESVEQADPRRAALPRDAGVQARARGPARAAPFADPTRAPPRAPGRVPVPPQAQGVGASVHRRRTAPLRHGQAAIFRGRGHLSRRAALEAAPLCAPTR